jgi:hypothetical protein
MVRPINLLFTWLSGPLLLELDSDANASINEKDESVNTAHNDILLNFIVTFPSLGQLD